MRHLALSGGIVLFHVLTCAYTAAATTSILAAAPDVYSVDNVTRSSRALAAAPQDIMQRVVDVVQDFCVANSGVSCEEIDFKGETEWFRSNFPELLKSMLAVEANITALKLADDPRPYSTSQSQVKCAYDAVASQTCKLSSQTLHSNTITASASFKVTAGLTMSRVTKAKIALGGGGEVQEEVSLGVNYNYAHQEVVAQISGDTAVAGVSVPMSPSDLSCVVIQIVLQRVKQTGEMDARLRVGGWFGTHQHPSQHWVHTDQPGESHYYRAHNFVDMVTRAKQLGRYVARDWQIEDGWAYLSNPVSIEVDVAFKGWTNPEMYNKDSPQCR